MITDRGDGIRLKSIPAAMPATNEHGEAHRNSRPNHLKNVERTIKLLGADYLKFRPSWDVVRKLMLESLKRKGDFCWHCHTGIFSYPMQVATQ